MRAPLVGLSCPRQPGHQDSQDSQDMVTLLMLGGSPPPHRRQGPTDPVLLFILFPNSSIYFSCNLFSVWLTYFLFIIGSTSPSTASKVENQIFNHMSRFFGSLPEKCHIMVHTYLDVEGSLSFIFFVLAGENV